MTSWPEAQYVIDELSEKFDNRGGVLPGAPVSNKIFSAKLPYMTLFDISAEANPGDVVLNGTKIAVIESIVVLKGEDHPPETPKDGRIICEIPIERLPITITEKEEDSSGLRYYSFFTKTTQGIYSPPFKATFNGVSKPIIGFLLKNAISDPSGRIDTSYVSTTSESNSLNNFYSSIGLGRFGQQRTPGPNMVVNYFLTHMIKNYPAAVNDDGTVRYWLNPKDYTKKIDGTESDWNNPDFDGNFCAWIGRTKFDIKTVSGNVQEWQAMFRWWIDPDANHNSDFYDWNDNLLEGYWLPMLPSASLEDRSTFISTREEMQWKRDLKVNGRDKFRALPETDRRVPMGYIEYMHLACIYLFCLKHCNSEWIFDFDVDAETANPPMKLTPDREYGIESVTYYPQAAFLHSCFLTLRGYVGFINDWFYVGPISSGQPSTARQEMILMDLRNKCARGVLGDAISTGNVFSPMSGYFKYFHKFGHSEFTNEHILYTPVGEAYRGGSSETYNCDVQNVTYAYQYPSAYYGCTFKHNTAGDGGIFCLYPNVKKIDEAQNFHTFIKVLPPPGYDPFEETNYHPWETLSDEYMESIGMKQ